MDPQNPQNPAQPAADPTPSPADPTPPANPNEPAPPDPGTGDDQQPVAPATPDDQQPADAGGQQPPTDGKSPKDMSRGERRIRQLSSQVKQNAQQPNQPQGGQQQSPQFPQYEDGQQVTTQQLQQDVVQTASAIAELQVSRQLAQRDAVNNFDRDSENIPTKFEELNPDNANYTPELDEAIAQEYQERAFVVIGYDNQGKPITQLDPRVRLSAIAERHVKSARAYAAKASAGQQTRTDAAADTTSPRPGGDRPAERKFEDLTLDEMRKKVGYHKV